MRRLAGPVICFLLAVAFIGIGIDTIVNDRNILRVINKPSADRQGDGIAGGLFFIAAGGGWAYYGWLKLKGRA